MLIQGSPRKGSFTWINLYKYRNPIFTPIAVLVRPEVIKFNNMDTTNVATNT